jgi:hypothetical protein
LTFSSSSEPAIQNKPWHRTGGNSYTYTSSYNNKSFSNNALDADRGVSVTSEPWRKKRGEPEGQGATSKPFTNYYDNKKYDKPYEKRDRDREGGYDKREGGYGDREREGQGDRESNAELFESFLQEFADVIEVSHQEDQRRFTRDEILAYYSPYYRPPPSLEQVDKVTCRIPLQPAAMQPAQYDDVCMVRVWCWCWVWFWFWFWFWL